MVLAWPGGGADYPSAVQRRTASVQLRGRASNSSQWERGSCAAGSGDAAPTGGPGTSDFADPANKCDSKPRLFVGLGCASGAEPDEILQLIKSTLQEAGLSRYEIACAASLSSPGRQPALVQTARLLGAPLQLFSAAELEAETPRLLTPSDAVFRRVGCHGVAESAALAAAGPDSRLVIPKTKGGRVTCAVALAASPLVSLPEPLHT